MIIKRVTQKFMLAFKQRFSSRSQKVSGELLARKIRKLIQDPQLIEQMAANCSRLAPKDAAGRVATTMEKYTTHEARF